MFIVTGTQDLMKHLNGDADLRLEQRSPVSIGPFDVLSYIFEICGEEDYRTTIKIAVVSRHWREVVLATPRAWAFVDIKTCTDDETVQLYFQRSGRQPLHICLPALRSFSLLTNVTGRLQCLSIYGVYGNFIEPVAFPNVTRLTIYGRDAPVLVSFLSFNRFPALRHLLSENRWLIGSASVYSPPLQSLSYVIGTAPGWRVLLRDSKDTLTSLKLHIASYYGTMSESSLWLPRLQCLDVEYEETKGGYAWPLGLKTPTLTTYIEAGQPPDDALPFQLENVKYLRIGRIPPLDALPNLRELELDGPPTLARAVFILLLDDPMLCPELTLVDTGWKE